VCVTFLSAASVVLYHVPSPKDLFQTIGDPVEVSLNCTASGAVPEVWLAVKLAVGGTGSVTVMFIRVAL